MTTIRLALAGALIFVNGLCFGMGVGNGSAGGNGVGNGNNGNNNNNNNYRQEDTKDTLNWPATKFEDAKKADKPVLLLVKDENDHLHRALKDLEKILDDSEVKKKLSEFELIEITHAASAGWKEALGVLPVGDTRLVVIAWSYEKRPVTIETLGQDKLRTTAQVLLSDIATVERLIQKNKDDAERDAKANEKAATAPPKK